MKKKLNNKGFAFAELLTVTVVVLGIFMVVYSNLFPIMGELEARQEYNDISSTYAAYYVRRLILNNEKKIKNQVTDGIKYKIIYNSTDPSVYDDFNINNIAPKLNIKKVYLSTYNISALKTDLADSNPYIDYLPNYNNYVNNKVNDVKKEFYRIIVETDTGYATMPIYSPNLLKIKVTFDPNEGTWINNKCPDGFIEKDGNCTKEFIKKEIITNYPDGTNIEREGFYFEGWIAPKTSDELIDQNNFNSNKDITLYAKWKSKCKTVAEINETLPEDKQIFTDDVFASVVLEKLNKESINEVTTCDLEKIESLGFKSKSKIESVAGIEYIENLKSLSLSGNQLTSIDLSKNTAITNLDLYNNQLTSIDLSKNTAITYLDLSQNQLTSIDLSKNTAITYLYLNNNQLTSIDLSNNKSLKTLKINKDVTIIGKNDIVEITYF